MSLFLTPLSNVSQFVGIKKPTLAKAGLYLALAVFIKRPQAVLQIGADIIKYQFREYAYRAIKSNVTKNIIQIVRALHG